MIIRKHSEVLICSALMAFSFQSHTKFFAKTFVEFNKNQAFLKRFKRKKVSNIREVPPQPDSTKIKTRNDFRRIFKIISQHPFSNDRAFKKCDWQKE